MPHHDDVTADGLALVEAAHRGDLEAGRVLLDACDARMVAAFLSRICADLIEQLASEPEAALAWLRESWTA